YQIRQLFEAVESNAYGAAAGMGLDEFGLAAKVEATIKGASQEVLNLLDARSVRVDVDLEVITLPGGVDAYRDHLRSEGPFQHGLDEVDERKPTEEIGAFDQVELGRLRSLEVRIPQPAVVIERLRADSLQPELEQRGAGCALLPGQSRQHRIAVRKALRR